MLASRGLGEPQAAIETPETTDTARPTEVSEHVTGQGDWGTVCPWRKKPQASPGSYPHTAPGRPAGSLAALSVSAGQWERMTKDMGAVMDSGLCERTNMVLGLNAQSCPGQTEPLQTQAGSAGAGRCGPYLEGLARL